MKILKIKNRNYKVWKYSEYYISKYKATIYIDNKYEINFLNSPKYIGTKFLGSFSSLMKVLKESIKNS
jgi:hypothetical protein